MRLRGFYPWICLTISVSIAWAVYHQVCELSRAEPVVVADKAIPQLNVINSSDVKIRYLHPDAIAPGAARNKEEVVGMASLRQVYPGEQIIKIGLSGHAGTLSSVVARGMRVLMLPMAPGRCGGGAIKRGDVVDLVFVSDRGKTGSSTAKTIARGVTVLDVRDEKGMPYSPGRDTVPAGILAEVPEDLSTLIPWCLENGNVYAVVSPFQPNPASAPGEVTVKEVLP